MTETVTSLLLVRHAHNPYLDSQRLAGRLPGVHLSERGQAQARAVAERLAKLKIAAVYSSPLERAQETARPIAEALALDVQTVEDLNETDCGEWTGQAIAELSQQELWRQVQVYPSGFCFPGGEKMTDVQARVVRRLDAICAAHAGATVVVVSHADPLRTALAHYVGTPLDLFQRIVISPASITELAFTANGPRLIRCNDCAHIS